MKIKAKIKDARLIVRVKLPSGMTINEREFDFFSKKLFQGFLKPKAAKRNVIDYSGPVGITLFERFNKPISKRDFLFIMEQIADAAQKLQKNNFMWNKVVWDTKYSYINEATKEVQFLYLPVSDANASQFAWDVREFMEGIAYSARPESEHDTDYVSRFMYFLQSIKGFDPNKVEEYIKTEDRSVVNEIKSHRPNSSGFITDKREDYYRHYGNNGNIPESPPTERIYETEESGTAPLNGYSFQDSGETTLLAETRPLYATLERVLTKETVAIDKPVFRLGKERGYVDYFVANNNAVSRSHADIVTRSSKYYVVDLNSKNGTYINERIIPAQNETEIFDGDRLKLANEEFIFHGVR